MRVPAAIRSPLPLLLLPAALLAFLFRGFFHRFLISDDVYYWKMSFDWQSRLESASWWRALFEIYSWPEARPSVHPLLSIPFLWMTGNSIERSVVAMGIFFTLLLTWSCFRLFRAAGLAEWPAVIGAVVAVTFPLVLTQARFFMMEFPYLAFAVTALACLVSGQWRGFAIFFTLSILQRPVEGTALAPAYVFFYVMTLPSPALRRVRPLALSFASAFLAAVLVFSWRLPSLQLWLLKGTFPASGGAFWSRLALDTRSFLFIGEKLFLFFGVSGLALLLLSLVISWRARGARTAAWSHSLILLLLCAALAFNSLLDDPGARFASYRYCLGFSVFGFLSALYWILRGPRWKPKALALLPFFLANGVVYQHFVAQLTWHDSFGNSSMIFHSNLLAAINNPGAVPDLMSELERTLPGGQPMKILLAGKDSLLFYEVVELNLRAQERRKKWEFSVTVPPGSDFSDLKGIGIDFVLYPPRTGYSGGFPAIPAYPSETLVRVLEAKKAASLGLEMVGEVRAPVHDGHQTLHVFSTERGRRLLGARPEK